MKILLVKEHEYEGITPVYRKPNIPGAYKEMVDVEHSIYVGIDVTEEPEAVMGEDGQPKIQWRVQKSARQSWKKYLEEGTNHKRETVNPQSEMWSRTTKEAQWFVDLDSLDDLLEIRDYWSKLHSYREHGGGGEIALQVYV